MIDKIQLNGVESPVVSMTKAEVNAQAEQRIRESAGSGFAEFGKHLVGAGQIPINEGMFSRSLAGSENAFFIGRPHTDAIGVSRTDNAIANVNGTQHLIDGTGDTFSGTMGARLVFPPAPDGTETYDSATGVVTEHASAAEAFEGLVTNGDFRNGDDGWTGIGTNWTIANGQLSKVNNTNVSAYQTGVGLSDGVSYRGEIVISTLLNSTVTVSNTAGTIATFSEVGTFTFEGVWDSSDLFYISNGTANSAVIDSFSLMPVTESVITSRQDFAFLESWHEKISDKDVVYPLGNVQFGGGNPYGDTNIPISTGYVVQGYSAFGEWDTATTGKAARWSQLSEAQKAEFIQNPENNIYSDDGELIQVRYRIRVVKGVGDDWTQLATQQGGYWYYVGNGQTYIQPKGSLTSKEDLGDGSGNFRYQAKDITNNPYPTNGQVLAGVNGTSSPSSVAHNGLCFAIPIALVQRRNQGVYHPSFNPEGTWLVGRNDASTNGENWYASNAYTMNTSSDCFNTALRAKVSEGGHIGGVSGRPDDKFYDAIYASDVQDLRMSSKRLPLSEIRENYKRKAIAGEVRGFEGVPFTKVSELSSSALRSRISNGRRQVDYAGNLMGILPTAVFIVVEDGSYAVTSTTREIHGVIYKDDVDETTFDFVGEDPYTSAANFVVAFKQLHSQANPTWTDIIGDPANIAATFPNGVEGQWIPVIPDGSNKDFPLTRKSLDVGSALVTYTVNNGTSWGQTNYTINATPNRVTQAPSSAVVLLMPYETQAHFTHDDVNSEVLDLGEVFESAAAQTYRGNALCSSLIGKVATSVRAKLLSNLGKPIGYWLEEDNKLRTSAVYSPSHPLDALGFENDTPAVKTLDYLSSENGVAKLCYAYKEMAYDSGADSTGDFQSITEATVVNTLTVGDTYFISDGEYRGVWTCLHNSSAITISNGAFARVGNEIVESSGDSAYFVQWDGNGWGDNNQFEITNNQSTMTDDNGNTVKYGTASFDTQYFIVEE